MKLNSNTIVSIRSCTLFVSVLLAVTLTACGGGNGSAGKPVGSTTSSGSSGSGTSGSGTTSTTGSIAMKLVSNSGCTANTVTTTCPLTATATLTDATGAAIPNAVVTFSNSLSLTVLSPTTGSTLTNSSGVATVQVATAGVPVAGQNGSAGTINASSTVGTSTITSSQNYTLGNSSVSLSVVTPSTSPFNLNAYGSTSIVVQVNSGGAIYTAQPVTVDFTSTCATNGKATLPASTATVNGQAVVTYTDKGCGAADTVVASVSGSTTSVVINVAAPGIGSMNFVSAVPSDASIVFAGSGGAGRTSTAILTFEVVDTFGNPLSNVAVTFSNNNTTIATLGNSLGITDQNGDVSTTVSAVGASGSPAVYPAAGTLAVTAVATVSTSPLVTVSAISSNVIVSTGVPVQAAMSMGPGQHNVEGRDWLGGTTNISFFLSDANGNPVVDGTPVAATTNEGGISNKTNSSNPGCTTVNGQCTLTFTTQNPETDVLSGVTQYGIATITGTSTNDTTIPLTATTTVYLSGSFPNFYTYNGSAFTWSNGAVFDLGSACSGTVAVWLSDEVGNPMAKGATIAVTAVTTGLTIGTYYPTAMPDDGRNTAAEATVANPVANLTNGSSLPAVFNANLFATEITIPVTAPSACGTGTAAATASFTITITNPNSGSSYITNFGIKYLD